MSDPRDQTPLEQLREELARKTEEVGLLRQVSSAVNSTLDLDEIYHIVLGTMDDLFGFHHALILLLDESRQMLRVVAARGYDQPALGVEVPVGVGIVGMVARRRKMMRVGNLAQSRSYAEAVRGEMARSGQSAQLSDIPKLPGLPDVESQIAIPLVIKDTLVGVFAVESAERQPFTERDETLVSIVANLSASAIHNALLYRRQEEYSQSLAEKVKERTQQLENKNEQLEQTLKELKETQNQLVIQEKMASLGNLAAGLAHEINTPLAVLNSNNDTVARTARKLKQLLEAQRADPDRAQLDEVGRLLDNISSFAEMNLPAVQRVLKIATSLRTFARLDRAAEDEVDIHEGLEGTLTLIRREIQDRITIHKDYGALPAIRCYPSRLNQVFLNLLMNAVQAIEGQGEIFLKTYAHEDRVVLEVTDTGVGIPAENLNNIFDPGFTTKGVKVGTGLGLSIVRRIVEEHDGKIEVESTPGKGSTFRLTLPVRPAIPVRA